MIPTALHHVSIMVRDLDEALDFYTGVLGMKSRNDRPEAAPSGAWLDVGEQQVHLVEGTPPPSFGQHFALRVTDLDAARDQLLTEGLEAGPPVTVGNARQAFIRDPSGNAIELHELPEQSPG